MGIPGLTRKVKGLLRPHDRHFFEGGDFYVDLLNFGNIIKHTDWASDTAETEAEHVLLELRKLKPNSITFVVDGMISRSKFRVRIGRSEAKLTRDLPKTKSLTGLIVQDILEADDITLVYSGTEGEDEIMKLIDEDTERGDRRQFIFSDDSDLFRFRISRPENVEIVSMISSRGLLIDKKPLATTINLSEVIQSKIIPESQAIASPIKRPGRSIINPTKACRNLCELINCGHIYHRMFIHFDTPTMDIVYLEPEYCAFDAGVVIRRTAYALAIRLFLKDDPKFNSDYVEEWNFVGTKVTLQRVRPLESEMIDPVLTLLRSVSLEKLLENQLMLVAKNYGLKDAEVSKTVSYIHRLITDDEGFASDTRPEAFSSSTCDIGIPNFQVATRIFGFISAVMKSLTILNQFLDTDLPLPIMIVKERLSLKGLQEILIAAR